MLAWRLSPTSSSMSQARVCTARSRRTGDQALSAKAPSRRAKAGIITFSMSVRSPKISGVWKTRAMPAWLISCGRIPRIERPSNSTVPVSGSTRPTRQFSSVDLPAPFGPMMARISPSATSRLTSSSAFSPPKCLFTLRTVRMLIPPSLTRPARIRRARAHRRRRGASAASARSG